MVNWSAASRMEGHIPSILENGRASLSFDIGHNNTSNSDDIAQIFADLNVVGKIFVVVLLTINVGINLIFKYLLIKLSQKIGSMRKHPFNGMILIDEFEKLIGCLSCTGR